MNITYKCVVFLLLAIKSYMSGSKARGGQNSAHHTRHYESDSLWRAPNGCGHGHESEINNYAMYSMVNGIGKDSIKIHY